MNNRMAPILIGIIGAFLGVSVVIGGLYVLLEYTNLVSDPAPAVSQPPAESGPASGGLPEVVVSLNGEAITRQMVEAEIKISRLNVNNPLSSLTGADLERAQAEAINQLTTRHLILQAATRQGYVLADDYVQQRVELLFGAYGDEALDQALQQIRASRADVTWWVREIFTVEGFTTEVIMAEAAPEARQQVYNDWLNFQRSTATITSFLEGEGQQIVQTLVGDAAPDFTLPTLSGQPTSLSAYRGQVVLVNFWATWCPSCIAEMPDYERAYQQHGQGQGEFMVLGVNLQESHEQASQFAAGLGVTFPVLLDEDGNVTTRQYQATGMPASFIIDQQGQIFYRHLGPMSGETLAAKLAELGL